jgi:hypothetical protein
MRRLGCDFNSDGENGCWTLSVCLYVGERCVVCWSDVFVESRFRWREGTVLERRWDTGVLGRYKASVLVRIFDGRFSSFWFKGEGLSICNVKKRVVEPTTDDNDVPLITSIGLTKLVRTSVN